MNTHLKEFLMQLCTFHKRIYKFDIAIILNYLCDKPQVGEPSITAY